MLYTYLCRCRGLHRPYYLRSPVLSRYRPNNLFLPFSQLDPDTSSSQFHLILFGFIQRPLSLLKRSSPFVSRHCHIYTFNHPPAIAPANSAAAPTAPVFIGATAAATPVEVDVSITVASAVMLLVAPARPPPSVVVGVGTSEVNGRSDADDAPE